MNLELKVQWNLPNQDTPRDQGNVSDCTACRNTQVLLLVNRNTRDHQFLWDVTGCWKTQVSDCTSSTVHTE